MTNMADREIETNKKSDFGRTKGPTTLGGRGSPSSGETRLSPSVARVVRQLANKGRVTAWEMVQTLLANHGEYARDAGREIRTKPGPARGVTQPVRDWIDGVIALFQPGRVPELHGRLLILGLTVLDENLDEYLAADGFLDALRRELRESLESLLRPDALSQRPAFFPDPTPLQMDHPALDDLLGRRGYARSLATRFSRVWNETSRSGVAGSFMVHLHGPWGAGKTTLFNLIREDLQPSEPDQSAASRWIVVEFNAWQHQRLDPPWWSLIDAVYRQSCDQIAHRYNDRFRAWRLRLRESWWRFNTGRRDVLSILVMFGLVAMLAAWIVFLVRPPLSLPGLKPLGEGAEAVAAVFALVTTLLSAGVLVSRSLLSGSSRAAQAFVHSASDPMERIGRHFRDLVGAIGQPILIFVDDLDRCQSAYVVALLEGIQTLFNDPRIVYLVSSDRRWLNVSFERAYDSFAGAVRDPGRGLGALFLEKAFEMSIPVPQLSLAVKQAYWDALVLGNAKPARQRWRDAEAAAARELAGATTEAAILTKAGAHDGDPVMGQAFRQAAVGKLSTRQAERSTFSFLQRFLHLLEPNPRAMKRLLNTYAVRRDLALITGTVPLQDLAMRERLALWTIISLRWSNLEDYLVELARGTSVEPSDEVRTLLASDEVRDVIEGKGVAGSLDLETIRLFVSV